MNVFKEAVQILAPQRSKFDLSHERKLTCEFGRLVPFLVQEIVPGDSFKVNTELMVRIAPMLAPLYHRMDVYTHYFFVPNRIIYNEWETFITGGQDGLQAPVHPSLNLTNASFSDSSLFDYMGLPTAAGGMSYAGAQIINALPFRAYLEIYNEYYRDQDLVPKVNYSKGSGTLIYTDPEFAQLITLRIRAWEKDYFTTARPTAQRGGAAGAPIDYTGVTGPTIAKNAATGATQNNQTGIATGATGIVAMQPAAAQTRLETPANVMIQEIRKAARLQEFLEMAQRGGARLTEWVLHVFGVRSSDGRLQRPEYLGGGKTPITISEVLSSYQDPGATGKPQGNMSGHGIGVGETHGFSRDFEDHGFVIGIMSVVPKANYYQGLERMWTRPSRFDYLIPGFAHLGEQEVKNREIYFDPSAGGPTPNNATFGYQSRYAEYKFKLSSVHGAFRNTMAYWHMSRKFASLPGLNKTFIECNPPKDILAVPTEVPCFIQIYNDVSAIRPLPYFSNPKL